MARRWLRHPRWRRRQHRWLRRTRCASRPGGQGGQAVPPPAAQIAILSREFFDRRFGGDTAIVGMVQQLGNQRFEIVGVLRPGAELLFPPNVNIERTPKSGSAIDRTFANGSHQRQPARHRPFKARHELARAQSEIDPFTADLRKRFPIKETSGQYLRLVPMHTDLVADVRGIILASWAPSRSSS